MSKFMIKPLPKLSMELELINTMINVLNFNYGIATVADETVCEMAKEIIKNKILDIKKVLENPSKYDKVDLISEYQDK
jgi:hypothetical protein